MEQTMTAPVSGLWRLRPQRLDSRQRLTFHPFEEGAPRCGHISELIGDAGFVERGDRVAPAGDRLELSFARQFADRLGDREGGFFERRRLEGAEWAVPDERLDPADRLFDRDDRLR